MRRLRELLIDHRHARFEHLRRLVSTQRYAAHPYLPGISGNRPRENLHQRRLAGTIFSDQRANLAFGKVERHITQRPDGAE